jgi:hypothetical protein
MPGYAAVAWRLEVQEVGPLPLLMLVLLQGHEYAHMTDIQLCAVPCTSHTSAMHSTSAKNSASTMRSAGA